MRDDCMPTLESAGCSLDAPDPALPAPQARIDRADELLARLIDDIGTGPALDRLRKDALRIKHVLRGLDW